MTVGKASALAVGFVAAVALGVAIGPTVHDRWLNSSTDNTPAASVAAPEPAPAAAKAPAKKSTATRAAAKNRGGHPPGSVSSVVVAVWEPEVRDRVKAVLNPGTRMELAAEGFETPEEFVTVAHAARNTSVPFMVLKHRVLNEGQTLAEAIHEAKPELNAKAEVARARAAAQSDLAG